ncbi:MAG TPA: glycosyltransferase family 39 protein [Planctomycetota bacterium]|nr:glycosyltransferase family 39 protein [Planctomycetota bacterium]
MGWLTFALALSLFAALTAPSLLESEQELFPDPDASEYLAGAVGILGSRGHAIPLGEEWHPSRYPPGYSLLIAGAVSAGAALRSAPFLVSVVCGFLMVVLGFLSGCTRGRWVSGGLVALLLASSPALIVLSRSPMSDAPAALYVLAAFLALSRSTESPGPGWGVLAAVCLGLAITTRISSVLFVPLLSLAVLGWPASSAQRVRRWLEMHAALLVSLVPLLASNVASFGRPLGGGYAYWAPEYAEIGSAFGLEHLPMQSRLLLREMLQMEWRTSLASHYAAGSYFGPASVALLVWTIARPGLGRSDGLLLLGAGLYAAAMSLYFYPDVRFYCPALMCALVVVARRVESDWTRGGRPFVVSVVLVLAHVGGLPGPRSLSGTLDLARSGPGARSEIDAATDELRGLPPGLVFTDQNPVFVRVLLGEEWRVLPAGDHHLYAQNPTVFRADAGVRRDAVQRALANRTPVYHLSSDGEDGRAAPIAGLPARHWATVAGGRAGSGVRIEQLQPQR